MFVDNDFVDQPPHQPHSVISAFVLAFCLKLYSLNFAIAHAKGLLCYQILVIFVLHLSTGKLNCHLKQAQKSILNVSNL